MYDQQLAPLPTRPCYGNRIVARDGREFRARAEKCKGAGVAATEEEVERGKRRKVYPKGLEHTGSGTKSRNLCNMCSNQQNHFSRLNTIWDLISNARKGNTYRFVDTLVAELEVTEENLVENIRKLNQALKKCRAGATMKFDLYSVNDEKEM